MQARIHQMMHMMVRHDAMQQGRIEDVAHLLR